MSDLELLWLVLLLLYLWECACWIPRESIALVSRGWTPWQVAWPSSVLSNQWGGFVLVQPFPPLGTIVVTNPIPLSLSPEGMLGFVSSSLHPRGRPPQTWQFVRFASLSSLAASGKNLTVEGKPLVRTGSNQVACALAQNLCELANRSAAERALAIDGALRASVDIKAVASRWDEFSESARPLWYLCNGLFLFIFLAVPLTLYGFGLASSWVALVAALFSLTAATAWSFRRAHEELYPEASENRFSQALTVFLAPTAALRARDILSRPLLAPFHPLAAACVLFTRDHFAAFARTVLLDARHPTATHCPNPEPAAALTEQFFRSRWLVILEEFLRNQGLDPATLDRAPLRLDESCLSYCPRCQAQFVSPAGECTDCGGLPLRSF
jgi:hypothetical protein